ncbi:glyoxal reductase-like [Diorhabda carinulata]|uniref:glyoxal reductase-like n=1 Tax=Diorhabda carinulata TaxID=1163345 RepID=UPI0025A16BAE|nr:glyoxal reductase-like [Diorhabda carinulata]
MIEKFVKLLSFILLIYPSNGLLTKDLKATLPSGDQMPMIGLGTSRIRGIGNVRNAIDDALAVGYRLFDTAAFYKNEEDLGKAFKELLPKYNLTRKDIFITSKLAPTEEDFGKHAYSALEKSVKTIGCDYLDLYLIHFPGIPSDSGNNSRNFSQSRNEIWQQLVKGVKNGLTRNIGVSNYNVRHLTELVNNDHGVKVAVNQVEWHPYYHQDDVLQFCKNHGILLQAYSSLGGSGNADLFNDTTVKAVAEKLNKPPAKILLRWALQQNLAIIPKSIKKQNMESNLDLNFEIPDEDMKLLSNIPQTKKYRWDPDIII